MLFVYLLIFLNSILISTVLATFPSFLIQRAPGAWVELTKRHLMNHAKLTSTVTIE